MKIIRVTRVDPGKLLLAVANNAEHIHPELQKEIANFMRIWSQPQITIKPVKVDL